ncbi:hypothetical protein D3C72_1337850 [compost metagenome]
MLFVIFQHTRVQLVGIQFVHFLQLEILSTCRYHSAKDCTSEMFYILHIYISSHSSHQYFFCSSYLDINQIIILKSICRVVVKCSADCSMVLVIVYNFYTFISILFV